MKLKKAMKKLKFWSSKKTKKKDNYYYEYYHKLPPPQYDFYPYIYHSPPPPPRSPTSSMPPPPPEGCECHFCNPARPSAPPLPAWLESQLQEGHHSDYDDYSNSSNSGINPEVSDDCIRISQEIVVITTSTDSETNTSGGNIQDTDETGETIDSSNLESQKEFPNSKSSEKDVAVGLFGCIIDVTALLFRCLNISDRPRRYNFNCSALPQKAITHQTTPLLMASGDVKEYIIIK